MMQIFKLPNRQRGLSLLEMLVAMVIGLFITVGIASIYVGNKRSSITTNEYTVLQDNGRAVLEMLTEVIQHTGYKSTSVSPNNNAFITSPVAVSSCNDGSENVVDTSVFSAIQNNTALGDTVGISFVGDSRLSRDCGRNDLPTECQLSSGAPSDAARIYNYFTVRRAASGVPVLVCGGSRSNGFQELSEGVENLQLTYGEDQDSNGVADRYVNSDNVSDWGRVVSVSVAVLVRSSREVLKTAEPRRYQLSDDAVIATNDKYMRGVFKTTIRLRNMLL